MPIKGSLYQVDIVPDQYQEKADLQSLNHRHEKIVNKQRELMRQVKELKEQLRISEETAKRDRQSYEERLEQLVAKLEAKSGESAKK